MRSSWKAAHTSRRASTAALIALALCAACGSARPDPGPAQEVGDTLSASRIWISKVRWQGIELLDRGALTSGSYLAGGELLTDSLLNIEMGRIDSVCFGAGLLAARAAVDTLMRGEAAEIVIRLSEGGWTSIGEVRASSSGAIPEEELAGRLGVTPGAPFDPAALEISMSSLLTELNREGYPYAQVWMTGFEYDRESNSVDLAFAVYAGEEAVVETVTFDGLARTDTSLAIRTSRLRPGRIFDEEKVARAKRYLASSGLFSYVGDPEVSRLGAGRVDVRIPVEEIKRGNSIQGIFGFAKKEDEYVTNGSVDIALRNIGGSGRDVDFRWLDDGLSYRTIQFGYAEDFFFSLPFGLDAEMRQDVFDTLYDYTKAGFDIRISTGPGSGILVGYAWDNNVPQDDPVIDRSVRHRFRAGLSTMWPGRAHLEARIEGAVRRKYDGSRTESDSQVLYGASGDIELPAFSRQSVYLRLVGEGVFSSGRIEPAEMYRLGGARSVRGYRENQFRGEQVGWGNFEYRFGGESRIFLFYDAGTYYREDGGWQFRDGFGFGLMSSSKLGTVALSFGMGERVALDGMLIHISLIENF